MKMKKKELIICIVAIVLIAAIGIAYSLSKAGSKTDEPKKIEKTAKKEDKKKTSGVKPSKAEDEKTNAKSDVKSEDEKKDDDTENTVKSEFKGSKASSSAKSSSSSASTPSHSSSSSSGTAPAPKPKRWVVDTPAWNEEVRQPVYVNTWWIKFVDGTTKTYYNKNEWINAQNYNDDNGIPYSYGNGERVPDPSGATEVVGYINHPEVGHWE